MKIRCTNCYRVLNSQEEYCTRCGTHSSAILELMTKGEVKISETKQLSLQLSLYFIIAFLINGILTVFFGVLFDRFYPGLYYGDMDERLPKSITLFASTNALLITGIALLVILLFINRRQLKTFVFKIVLNRFLWSIFGSIFIMIGIGFLFMKTDFIIISSFFQAIMKNKYTDLIYQPKLSTIWVILVSYALIQEMIFRHQLVRTFDEATLLPDGIIIVLVTIISVFFEIICFSFDWSFLLGSFLIQLIATLGYFFNKRLLSFNLFFRIALITMIILI